LTGDEVGNDRSFSCRFLFSRMCAIRGEQTVLLAQLFPSRVAKELRVDKIKVLLFAANPRGTDALDLNREYREINQEIRFGEFRDALDLIIVPGTRIVDLLRKLNEDHPNIVHFSGHGNIDEEIILESGLENLAARGSERSSPARDMRRLEPEDVAGGACSSTPLSKSALVDVLRACNEGNIRVVVLNACHTRPQAQAISEVVDCVISMNRAISDVGAIKFAASFYGALAFGRSVKNAFEQGLARLKAERISDAETPELLLREGVDASKLVVVGPPGNSDAIKISDAILTVPLPQIANSVRREGDFKRLQANLRPLSLILLGLTIATIAVALPVSARLFWAPRRPARPPGPADDVVRAAKVHDEKDLEIISLTGSKPGELDVTLRNIGNEPAVIHQIDLTIEKENPPLSPIIQPSGRYEMPIDDLQVGATRSLNVSHYVQAHGVDRFTINIDTVRNLVLRLTLRYNKGQKVEQICPPKS
jgi:hypothetical protein